MNQKTKKLEILAAVMVAAALAVTGILVFAGTNDGTTGASSVATSTSFLSKVAKNLGIDETRLQAAIASAREQTIDEDLTAGRITEEQAAAMKERLTAEKAMDELIASGIASGKITQEQADLVGGRLGGGMMGERGQAHDLRGACEGQPGRGVGR